MAGGSPRVVCDRTGGGHRRRRRRVPNGIEPSVATIGAGRMTAHLASSLAVMPPRTSPVGWSARGGSFEHATGCRARRRHRCRDRRQQPRLPPRAPRLDGHRPDREGPAPEPGRLDRPRLELHLPDRPLARDDRTDRGQRRAVQGDGRLHPERRHRGRPNARADGGAQAPDGVVPLVGDRVRARDSRADQGDGPLRQHGHPARRLLDTGDRRRRFAPGGHDHARARPGAGCAPAVADDRGHRHRRRGRARHPGPDRQGRLRGGHRGHRGRRLEPAHRGGWPGRRSRSRRRSTR